MEFKLWESSFNDLYNNIETTFPKTTKRQHATQPIEIKNLRFVPYKGMKTLFIRGLAQNENREYSPMILFKRVHYRDVENENTVSVKLDNGKTCVLEKVSLNNNDLALRCECKDFYYRFHHYNKLDKSLYGRDRTPYIRKTETYPPANPTELPGMCKHCIKMIEVLRDSGIIKE